MGRVIALYFFLAFLFTWGLQLPALLAAHGVIEGPPSRFMALVGLGAFGPMLAAMVAAWAEGTGVRALLRPLAAWRVELRWYLAALLLPGGVFIAAACLYDAFGHTERLFYLPDNPAYVAAAVVFPIGEEIGWRGFALPRLSERFGPLTASDRRRSFWAPLARADARPARRGGLLLYLVFLPCMIAGSILFTWIYRHARGSLLLAVLTHVGTHLDNPGHAMPGRILPITLHAWGYVALAIALVGLDRRAFDRQDAKDTRIG